MWAERFLAVVLAGVGAVSASAAGADLASPARIELVAQKAVLAQRFGPGQARWGAGFAPGGFGAMAGPPLWGMGFGLGLGGAAADDAGPVLVDLIQKTIAPGHWAPQGGPGTIYYWRPGRALIIRGSQQAHEQISDLLRQLERAGR